MNAVVRAVIEIVDVLVVTKGVDVGVVLVLVVGGVDVTVVVGVAVLAWIAEAVAVEGRRVDGGIVADPPPASGSSIWKLTSDVGVGDVAVLVVAVVDERVVNGIVVGVAVVVVVDAVVVAFVVVVVLFVDAVVVGAVVRVVGVVDVLAVSGVVVVGVVALVVDVLVVPGEVVVSDFRMGACSLSWSSWARDLGVSELGAKNHVNSDTRKTEVLRSRSALRGRDPHVSQMFMIFGRSGTLGKRQLRDRMQESLQVIACRNRS